MAFIKLFIVFTILSISIPSTYGVEHIVGDETGWTINFDYQAWAQGKVFHVGDKLVFKYPHGVHNVLRVDGVGFKECSAPSGVEALTSGNDAITLASLGKKWYICGVGQHCAQGKQKLVINVVPQVSILPLFPGFPPTASAPASAPHKASPPYQYGGAAQEPSSSPTSRYMFGWWF